MSYSNYKPGKLYKTKAWVFSTFYIWDPNPDEYGQYRTLFAGPFRKDLIFLYIKFIPENEKIRDLHLVIYQEFIGFVDAGMELEEMLAPSEEESIDIDQ